MFIDASAFCAILLGESDSDRLVFVIALAESPATSAIAVWETARALVARQGVSVATATQDVENFLGGAGVRIVPIGRVESRLALEAFDRFGKGRHPAALNMGDCFAYACARSLGVPLLFKGDDFSQTDIETAG